VLLCLREITTTTTTTIAAAAATTTTTTTTRMLHTCILFIYNRDYSISNEEPR
jgi:hypothetical protein